MYAAIDMRLGGEVYDRVSVRIDTREHRVAIGDVAHYQSMTRAVQPREIVGVTRIREQIEVDDFT